MDPISMISLSVKNLPMIGVPDAAIRVIHSFNIQRCSSPSRTSGSEEPGSVVLEYLTIHFHDGDVMRLRGGDDKGYLERGSDAGENDRSRKARSSPARKIAVARV
jgi:hypothetical protein